MRRPVFVLPGQLKLIMLTEQIPFIGIKNFQVDLGFSKLIPRCPMIWSDDRIDWWYRQNIFIYEKSQEPEISQNQSRYSKRNHLVHPKAFQEKLDELNIENASVRNLCKALLRKIVS